MKLLLFIILLFASIEAQVKNKSSSRITKESLVPPEISRLQVDTEVSDIFRNIEHSIRINSTDEFGGRLGDIVSMVIGSNERGYFSLNQANSILSNYFNNRRCVSFEFSKIHNNSPVPYATGRFIFIQKGNQEHAQIYVSLSMQRGKWIISQFNIY